jgi:hypothetical protein
LSFMDHHQAIRLSIVILRKIAVGGALMGQDKAQDIQSQEAHFPSWLIQTSFLLYSPLAMLSRGRGVEASITATLG